MRYLSLDIETTGLDENHCQILQLAAVYDDTSKPLEDAMTFNTLVKHEHYQGEPYALALNRDIFDTLASIPSYYGIHYIFKLPSIKHHNRLVDCVKADRLVRLFKNWLDTISAETPIVLAGKNVAGFDLKFLRLLDGWSYLPIHHRVLDPGNLYLRPTDLTPPSTDECLRRAGFVGHTVSHDAIDDAIDDAYDICHLIRVWEQRHVDA